MGPLRNIWSAEFIFHWRLGGPLIPTLSEALANI